MRIEKITPLGFAANTYAVTKDGQTALVIDPSQERVAQKLRALGLSASHVLLTHCHFDHTMGVPVLQAQGAKVWCGEREEPLFETPADLYEYFGAPYLPFVVDGTFSDGQEIELCGLKITVLHTPGHTSGGVSYLIQDGDERALFTGDTLFRGSIGRTDFPTGNVGQMRESLCKLKNLQGDMPVYAGHEEDTTLQTEREKNAFLKDA